MWLLIEIVFMIAVEWCSWRVWLGLGSAVGIVVGFYYKYPEQNGLWPISYPAAIIVTALGFWWQYRADRS